jgi:glycosyltransferase involved in cell wall biosynthesis
VIDAAGINVRICPLDIDRRLSTRLLKRFIPSAYFRPVAPSNIKGLNRLVRELSPEFIFLNQVNLAVFAPALKPQLSPECKIVLLSHGLESTDLLHLIRLRTRLPLTSRPYLSSSLELGAAVLRESVLRTHIDCVCALSESDVVLEHWIGASRVDWLPRTIQAASLLWAPRGNYFGFVGTLDHAPNLEGLVLVLEELQAMAIECLRIRVVGGPARTGEWLSSKYGIVDYLGPLSDADLRAEARSWNAFLHPIFCHARGCSTKLASAIAWQIPVVTTTIGRRGYLWKDGDLIIADDPAGFARQCMDLLNPDAAEKARLNVVKVTQTSPTIDEVAMRMRALLEL